MDVMTSERRVLHALRFERPDEVPVFDSFWPEFLDAWRREKGLGSEADIDDYYGNDVRIVVPDETPFPSERGIVNESGDRSKRRDGWGAIHLFRGGAKFSQALQVILPNKGLADRLSFESPLLESRYASVEEVEALKRRYCVFVKTGGPYLRTSNLRGTSQWLIDLVEDEAFARELAMRVTRHITAVGLEAVRRYSLWHTGVWFYDDMGSNAGPMFSPQTFKRVFLPCYRWMCEQYRAAGVQNVILHCDGNLELLLDMLIDAGIQGIHPVESKAGMDVVTLRKQYGTSLALLGGLDNAHILTRGDLGVLKAHVLRALEVGQDGGLVIGAHSIGPDVSVDRYDYGRRLIRDSRDRKWTRRNP